jgi:hypothetical protein
MSLKPTDKGGIDEVLQTHAAGVVKKMTERDVMESLRAQGIVSLEDLVKKSLAGIKKDGVTKPGIGVARDTFIYTQAVYKTAMPIGEDLIKVLSSKIRTR